MGQERRYYRPRRYRLPDGRDWFGDESSGLPDDTKKAVECQPLPKPELQEKEQKDA